MIGGILIGVCVTALIFFLVWLLKNGSSPTPAVYLLLVVGLLVLCVEGIWMVKTIQANREINRTVTVEQIEEGSSADNTVVESSKIVHKSVEVTVTKVRNGSIWTFVISAIVLGVLMYAGYGVGSSNVGTRGNYGATGDSDFGTDYLNF